MPVAYKVVHELRALESEPKLKDLVARLKDCVRFDGRKVLYSWIGGTRRDWRGQGHFRALTEESEAWAHSTGFHEVVVKTKNKFYDMRGTLDQLQFDVVKYEVHPADNRRVEGLSQQAAHLRRRPRPHQHADRRLRGLTAWPASHLPASSTSAISGGWRSAACRGPCSITSTAAPMPRSRWAKTAASSTE